MGNINTVSQSVDVESDTLMSDSEQLISPLISLPFFNVFGFSSNSAKSPTSPISFSNFTSNPNANSLNPTSPVGLSLVLALETNSLNEAKNIVFSPKIISYVPVPGTPEIVSIPGNQKEPVDMVPPPLMHGPLTLEEIMFSEEYTCIRVYTGPNPRVTHIFGDYILKTYPLDAVRVRTTNPDHSTSSNPGIANGLYLKNCHMCKKVHLRQNNIYLYKDMAFCSKECRYQEIWLDKHIKRMKKRAKRQLRTTSSNSRTCTASSSTSQEGIFFVAEKPKSQLW